MRFPREWLGPVEELVPIGTTARGRAADALEDTSEAAPSASAFWTADAAALHSAVQAPTPGPSIGAATTESPPPLGTDRRHRRLLARGLGRRPGWAQVRLWPALAALAVATIAVVGLLGRLEGRPARLTTANARLHASRSVVTSPRVASASAEPTDEPGRKQSTYTQLALQTARRRAASPLRSRQRQGQRRATSHDGRSRAPHRSSHHAARTRPAPAPAVQQTRVQPAPAQTTPSYPSPEAPSAGAVNPVTTVAPTGAATDAAAPTRPSSPARHDTSQPAFGNNGTLGPGSSPDS